MIKTLKILSVIALFGLSALNGVLFAADKTTLTIGFLDLANDRRYVDKQMRARYPGQPWGRPLAGAEVAVKESRFALASQGFKLALSHKSADTTKDIIGLLQQFSREGVQFVLLDLPDNVIQPLAQETAALPLTLFNLSAGTDALRQKECQSNLLHIAPSKTMLNHALAQFLVSKKWRQVLLLVGEGAHNLAELKSVERAMKRYGLKTARKTTFKLGLDPRNRSQNNIALLTTGVEYDVVWVVDGTGEFARDIPYKTQLPRPVVGDGGLVADGWHWAWERFGAPQLNKRFMKKTKRHMVANDWAAWMGIKVVAEAVLRTASADFSRLNQYIKSDNIILDGFKGARMSFRSWNNQLRQPLFLTTGNWVVDRAPLEGFLHAKNNLDALGIDRRESQCRWSTP